MFWKKKKKCEHEWVYIHKGGNYVTINYEVYCPKCNQVDYFRHKENALACVRKSKLRKNFLDSQTIRGR